MNLAIDAGNTFVKVGVFEADELVEHLVFPASEDLGFLNEKYNPAHVIFSSVSVTAAKVHFKNVLILDSGTAVPIINAYKTPQTLGMDRLAGVIGARVLFPDLACLVIDAGTCITYDFVDTGNIYQGGSISPGISMRFKALNTFTQKLPLIEKSEGVDLIGKTTEEAIRSGVLNGAITELEGIIGRYKVLYPSFKILICGGDAAFFESKIKETIFAVPELVLIGLNRILEYNVSGN